MDLTQLFKASVKTVRLRCKIVPEKSRTARTLPDKNRILKKNRDDFLLKANDVRYQVTQLCDLLIENRPAYMRFGYHLKTATQMTDAERDIIDSESEKIILISNQYINDLKMNILEKDVVKTQFIHHKLAILDILTNYLKNVYRLHNEQKENRTRHEVETFKLLKLQTNQIKPITQTDVNERNKQEKITTSNACENRKKIAIEEDQKICDENKDDDFQVLELENSQLLNNLKGLADEVEQIGKHVAGIAKLQEIFTEKVAAQSHDIERIELSTVRATENIKDANEQIKQAIQRNAGLRVWVLFFLIIMSFSLLFLDWYND